MNFKPSSRISTTALSNGALLDASTTTPDKTILHFCDCAKDVDNAIINSKDRKHFCAFKIIQFDF